MGGIPNFRVDDILLPLSLTKVVSEFFEEVKLISHKWEEYLKAIEHCLEASVATAGAETVKVSGRLALLHQLSYLQYFTGFPR
mmetsp:Transcript_14613/g.27736  ORF Transcript_14613/g.27736 Transcript_14613/m.27736 type:complete len:83 (-) Transcript_14613:435-683(-)